MRITLLLFLIFITSCSSDKVIELPEIQQAAITELTDISPAYLFYDETQPDSLELNRKNLISTTNWVVNVDKRLTLQQVIPKIQFLQEKKNSSSHKNEAAKNYYTCYDLSQNNLGFIEFTDIVYKLEEYKPLVSSVKNCLLLYLKKGDSILMYDILNGKFINRGLFNHNKNELKNYDTIILSFDKELTFQEYIGFKSDILSTIPNSINIIKSEFIY